MAGVVPIVAAVTLTALLALAGSLFGDSNPFTDCVSASQCTGAAIEAIADGFEFDDIPTILSFFFIFIGDLLELMVTLGGLLGAEFGAFILVLLGVVWLYAIIGLFL